MVHLTLVFYTSSQDFKFVGYCDSDWTGDIDDRKSITGFIFFMGNMAFTRNSKEQPIVTLSMCKAEYVAATSCVCYAISLGSLTGSSINYKKAQQRFFIDNKSALAFAKTQCFMKGVNIFIRNIILYESAYLRKKWSLSLCEVSRPTCRYFHQALKYWHFSKVADVLWHNESSLREGVELIN